MLSRTRASRAAPATRSAGWSREPGDAQQHAKIVPGVALLGRDLADAPVPGFGDSFARHLCLHDQFDQRWVALCCHAVSWRHGNAGLPAPSSQRSRNRYQLPIVGDGLYKPDVDPVAMDLDALYMTTDDRPLRMKAHF